MNTQEKLRRIEDLLESLGDDEAIKRLEGVAGPERSLVSPTRSGGEQDAVEDLREGSRVSPGEARDALQWAAVQAFNAAADRDKRADICAQSDSWDGESHHKEQAARFRSYAETLAALVPQPDSVALKERSGRRNS